MGLLSVAELSKQFGPHVGVDSISFELGAEESVMVVGANGAGKTTLIRMLASLARPSAGEILLDGAPLFDGDGSVRSRIGVLAHETMLYEALSARENLRLHARLHGVDEARCERRLEDVGLAHRGSERVSGFSHGMRKRVSLARALIHDPDLLLLDEPYTGLDQRSLERITAVLADVEDRAVVAATHNLEAGLALADRILFLNDGQLVGDSETASFETTAAVIEQYERLCRGQSPSTPAAPGQE